MALFQGIFRRGQKYIAVRYIRLSSSDVLEPGTEVPSKKFPLKQFHLRSLFLRRRIGIKDSPWTKAMLAAIENSRAKPELQKETPEETKAKLEAKAKVKLEAKQKKAKAKAEKKAKAKAKAEAKAKAATKPKPKSKTEEKSKAQAGTSINPKAKLQPWLAK